ncbi:MAG TPA: hypothetical protein VF781_16120 [Solirubrobacteraceae bacterium]
MIATGFVASLVLTACGSGTRQDASEPKGRFPVAVDAASFPSAQTLSEHAHLTIAVRNAGSKTIPDIAVTICNVTCAYPASTGHGTSVQAFSQNLNAQYLANPSRPVWIVDQSPGVCRYSCQNGGPGAAVTAYSNTWALGPLRPGQTARFDWKVTAVAPGRHVVAWEIAAGLNGRARAVVPGGGLPHGSFAVNVSTKPAETYVNNSGQIINGSGQP